MERLPYFTLVVLLAVGIGTARAQSDRKSASGTLSMSGVVKAVSASTLTIERNGAEILFSVRSSTRVFKRGGGGPGVYPNGARDLVARPSPVFADLVKPGERVTVRFRRAGSALQAVEVRVLPAP
jgi:hypothetical protein